MSRIETLELLGSVIDSMESIDEVERGTPLKATNWNTMVDAVTTLAKMVASRERTTDAMLDERYAAISHSHTGQASMGWFEPHTQQLIEKSINGNVEQRNDIRELQNRTKAIQKDIKDIKSQITDLRIAMDGLRDNDGIRENSVNRIGLRVEGLSTVDKQMADLNTRFDLINKGVDTSLEFQKQLTDDNGNLINIGGIKKSVDSLNSLKENLTLHDGNLVQIREMASAITRLEENAINRNDVDDVIMNRLRDGDILDSAEIVSSVSTIIDEKYTDRFNDFDTKTAELESSMASIDAGVKENSVALNSLNSKVDTNSENLQVVARLTTDMASVKTKVTAIDAQVAANKETLTQLPLINSRLKNVESKTELIETLNTSVKGIDSRLKGMEEIVSGIDDLKAEVRVVDQRVVTVEQQMPVLSTVSQQVDIQGRELKENRERLSVNESQLKLLPTMNNQLGALENNTARLNSWRELTDKKIANLWRNSLDASVVNSRLSFLETRTAETTSNVKELSALAEKNAKSTLLISRKIGLNL